jgi:hypothetical protein
VRHPTVVGDMYEGLTGELLRKALPFPNVGVSTGFIEDERGKLSPQLDRLVVLGEGREVPYSSARVFPIKDVVAVLEVKKSLYARDLSKGYDNLREVGQLEPSTAGVHRHVVEGAFHCITGRACADDPLSMPEPWRTIYLCLAKEGCLPARILIGYHGYKSLEKFRLAVGEHVEANLRQNGFGPLSWPSLVLNERYAIGKNDGFPYNTRVEPDGTWPFMLSSSTTPPLRALLEVLWTRLTMRFGEPDGLFGEDLELECWERLLDFQLDTALRGWLVTDHSKLDVREPRRGPTRWQPVELSLAEFTVANWFCGGSELDVNTPPKVALASNAELEQALKGLVEKKLVGSYPDQPNKFRLLTRQLGLVLSPQGKFLAGENISGQLSRWVASERKQAGADDENTS